jgi:hypothetical protein
MRKRDASSIIGFAEKQVELYVETGETEDSSSESGTVVVTSRGEFQPAEVLLRGVISNCHSSHPAGVQANFMQGIRLSEGLSYI